MLALQKQIVWHLRFPNESPVGRALMGKQKGDVVKVELPDGEVEYKVLNITRG